MENQDERLMSFLKMVVYDGNNEICVLTVIADN